MTTIDPAVLARSLPPMRVAERAGRVRARLLELGADALVVTKLVNIRWLTGFSGSAAVLVVAADRLLLLSDGRYRDQAAEELAAAGVDAQLEIRPTIAAQREVLAAALARSTRIGLEADAVTWADQRAYASLFDTAELVPLTGVVDGLRQVKDDGEVARIAAAAAIADRALGEARPRLLDGPTERDFAAELDWLMRRHGASASSFETIVASGPNGAKPHARPSERRIGDGDLVVVDFGALVDGYCSDMTRTLAVGELSATQRRMFDVVVAAQAAGVATVGPGVAASAVDRACRAVIAEAGWADAFTHGTGHGVGLEIHEDPRVSSVSDTPLAAGHVVTVEPGVYLPEHGGVRIEDSVLVTADGCRPLTTAPKDPSPCPPSPPTT